MAIEIRFRCKEDEYDFLTVECLGSDVCVSGICSAKPIEFYFDKTTAIKLAKTLRTEINKIQE